MIQAQIQALLTESQTLSRNRFQRLQLTLVAGRTQMLDLACPLREDHAICTAFAPEAVFTVRTYATTAP